MKNLSYMEISKKVFLIFSAVLMLSIAIRWHTNTQITVNEDLAIEEYELPQSDYSEALLQKIYPISCSSSADKVENNFCEELYYDDYFAEGWVTSDEICYKEYITFVFKENIYLEFLVIQNFKPEELFDKYDKIKELNISYSNNDELQKIFTLDDSNISQWVNLDTETNTVTFDIQSSYNNPENSVCALGSVTFYGRKPG